MRYVIGLTGGIASGKSAVSNIFFQNGVSIIDADVVSRFVMRDGSACAVAVLKAFPSCENDGKVDRKKLRQIVFCDKEKLNALNSITHPFIKEEITRQIECLDGLILLVVPLLFETGYDKVCDCVVCVTSDVETRIKRLVLRDNIDKCLALDMINSQMSDDQRIIRSDYVIENNACLNELNSKVSNLLKIISENTHKNK